MTMYFFRACVAGVMLIGAVGLSRAGEDKSLISEKEILEAYYSCETTGIFQAAAEAAADAPHIATTFGLGINSGGDAVVQLGVKHLAEDKSDQDFTFCLPVARVSPVLGPIIGIPAELLGDHLMEFAGQSVLRLACEKVPCEAYPLQPCGPATSAALGAAEECEMPDPAQIAVDFLKAAGQEMAVPVSTCPYLRQKSQAKEAVQESAASLGSSVLENLAKLEKARSLLEQANAFLKKGNVKEAENCYCKCFDVCSGSRYEQDGTAGLMLLLKEHHNVQPAFTPSGYLYYIPQNQFDALTRGIPAGLTPSETLSPDLGVPYSSEKPPYPGKKTSKKTKATQDERKEETPSDRNVRMEQLINESEELPQIDNEWRRIWFSDHPPIEPQILQALEKILAATADPLSAKLVVFEEPQSAPPEQDETLSTWATGEPPVAIPSLLADPENQDLSVESEQEEPPEETPRPDVNGILGELIQSVRGGSYIDIDVDCSREDCVRAQFELQVDGMEIQLNWSDAGPKFAVIKLLPEAVTDLRAAQRAHNDEIIAWIQSVGGSIAESAEAWFEDADYFPPWEDDREANDIGLQR